MRHRIVRALGLAFVAGAAVAGSARADVAPPSTVDFSTSLQREQAQQLAEEPPLAPPRGNHVVVDHSGRRQEGKASIYAHGFDGRTMADGNRYDPNDHVAASKGLPLGTTAVVTNLQTGRSSSVRVEDRGPYVDGRVVDLSPKVAAEIGLGQQQGVAPVEVAPVTVPQPDGGVKPGAGAAR